MPQPLAFYFHHLNLGWRFYAVLAGLLALILLAAYLWVGYSTPEVRPDLWALAADLAPLAERAVIPGRGHVVQRAPGFNDVLEAFLNGGTGQPKNML